MKGITGKKEREIAVAILKSARKRIDRCLESWVCCAIADVSDQDSIRDLGLRHPKNDEREAIGKALKKEISERLDGCTFVTTWLENNAGVPRSEACNYEYARQYRVRWIDSMIEELK